MITLNLDLALHVFIAFYDYWLVISHNIQAKQSGWVWTIVILLMRKLTEKLPFCLSVSNLVAESIETCQLVLHSFHWVGYLWGRHCQWPCRPFVCVEDRWDKMCILEPGDLSSNPGFRPSWLGHLVQASHASVYQSVKWRPPPHSLIMRNKGTVMPSDLPLEKKYTLKNGSYFSVLPVSFVYFLCRLILMFGVFQELCLFAFFKTNTQFYILP